MKRREFGKGYKGFYDPVLLRLFPKADTGSPPEPAYRYLVQNRKILVDTISTWAGLPKYSVHELVSRLTVRARSMLLTLPPDHDRDLLFRVGICLNSLLLSEQASYTNQTNP